MPKKRRKSIDEKLGMARLAVDNGRREDIQPHLVKFGYSPERIDAGETLLKEGQKLQSDFKNAKGNQLKASNVFQEARQKAWDFYIGLVKICRRVFPRGSGTFTKLELGGNRKRNFNGFVEQSSDFFDNVGKNPDILEELAPFNITAETLTEGKQLVQDTVTADDDHENAKSAVQEAALVRDRVIRKVMRWYYTFITAARVALADHTQLLEKFGISAPR